VAVRGQDHQRHGRRGAPFRRRDRLRLRRARADGIPDADILTIPDDVGGRFSVFTPVGLLPAAVMGLDVRALLLGAADRAIGLVRRFAACFRDARAPERVEHEIATLVGQRVFGIALGYEDLVDHDQLRHDPALAVLAIFAIMWRWNDFLWPLIVLTRNEQFTLQLALNSFQGELSTQWNNLLAMTVLTLLPITCVFAFLQRYITAGIATTGIK